MSNELASWTFEIVDRGFGGKYPKNIKLSNKTLGYSTYAMMGQEKNGRIFVGYSAPNIDPITDEVFVHVKDLLKSANG